ncbi:MAG: hypothetical protein Ct9H300mP17_15130 [Candidatus Nitrosopelagicus sp.]|nr:MAG: hypothetical protein Ct9H300mP17_15130 [Candidatus Nitrosopelagicus sp.]
MKIRSMVLFLKLQVLKFPDGNVVGMMPHPERAAEKAINQIDHKPSSLIFESLVETVGMKN